MRDQRLFLEDIIEAMEKTGRYVSDLTYASFIKNEMAVDAVLRNLEVIGEAAANISVELRDEYCEIPWKRMKGLRNIVAHEYFGIDLRIIWEIVTVNLPQAKPALQQMILQIDIDNQDANS